MTEFEGKKHSIYHNEAKLLVLVNLTHYFGMDTLCPQISQELAIIFLFYKFALSDFYVNLPRHKNSPKPKKYRRDTTY